LWRRGSGARLAEQKREIDRLTRDLANAPAAAGVGPDAAAAIGKLTREIERLKDKLATAEARLADDPGEAAKLMKQLKAARTRAQNEARSAQHAWQVAKKNPATMAKSDWRKLQKIVHPDRLKASLTEGELNEGAKILNGLQANLHD
jgi:hypothetical protein